MVDTHGSPVEFQGNGQSHGDQQMINNPDTSLDNSDFWHLYTGGEADNAKLDSSGREAAEWQFDGVAPGFPSDTSNDWRLESDCQGSFGLESPPGAKDKDTGNQTAREVDEWQYCHLVANVAQKRLLDDAAHDECKGHAQGLTQLQEELLRWLPPT
jgi:hypothetical protein